MDVGAGADSVHLAIELQVGRHRARRRKPTLHYVAHHAGPQSGQPHVLQGGPVARGRLQGHVEQGPDARGGAHELGRWQGLQGPLCQRGADGVSVA